MRVPAVLLAVLVLTALIAPAADALAQAQRRVALVIGIDAYLDPAIPRLRNAVADARAMSEMLRGSGFEVIDRYDPRRRQINQALEEFVERARGADVAFFFFAGHGIEVEGQNFLLPSDYPADVASSRDAAEEGLMLQRMTDRLAEANALFTAAVIDACRNNPLPRRATRQIGGTRGLAPATPPQGLYMVFAAGVGETAIDTLGPDDRSPNGLFTRHLLAELPVPGRPFNDAVRAARERVRTDARRIGHLQNPAIYDQAVGDFVLAMGPPPLPPAVPPPPPTPPSNALSEEARELAFWQSVERQDQTESYEAYLRRYPRGHYADLARLAIARLSRPPAPASPPPTAVVVPPPTAPTQPSPEAVEAALGLNADQIRGLQAWLTALGHDTRGVDGRLGPGTRSAVRAFQRTRGVPETGFLTAETVKALAADGPPALARAEEDRRTREAAAVALAAAQAAARPPDRPPVPPLAPSPVDRDAQHWAGIPDRDTNERGVSSYLTAFPDGQYAVEARMILERIRNARSPFVVDADARFWGDIKDRETNESALTGYLMAFPGGRYAAEARALLDRIRTGQAAAAVSSGFAASAIAVVSPPPRPPGARVVYFEGNLYGVWSDRCGDPSATRLIFNEASVRVRGGGRTERWTLRRYNQSASQQFTISVGGLLESTLVLRTDPEGGFSIASHSLSGLPAALPGQGARLLACESEREPFDGIYNGTLRCTGPSTQYSLSTALRITHSEIGGSRSERGWSEKWTGTADAAGRVRIQAASFTREGVPATHTYSGEIAGTTMTLSGFRWSDRCSGTLFNYAAR
jgi:peptidoglycan hydrolase-like protein with peptidoglycan-binding domain